MSFHEVRFPANLSFGAVGGPERRTDIVELASGHEERNTPWSQSRRRYDAGSGLRSLDDVAGMIGFFEARDGQVHGFRWKDWADFKSCAPSKSVSFEDQTLGLGDGTTRAFQLLKKYGDSARGFERKVSKPVSGTVLVGISGEPRQEAIDWDIDLSTGIVTFKRPPDVGARVTAGFEFDVPVRFDTDRIVTSVSSFQAGEIPSVPVVEVRV